MSDTAPDLTALLAPRAVAIVGASNDPSRIGGRPLRYMLGAGFDRPIYPVNPNRGTVQGVTAYPSIDLTPQPIDCAIIALPAEMVVRSLEDCADHGVKSAVIFSSGFAETGAEGAALQARLTEITKRRGIRVVGPNCLGIFNAAIGFYASFSTSLDGGFAEPGAIAIISQSGAYGSHVFAVARNKGLGVRTWITTGNECDVEVGECIAWAAEADDIRVIVAYAEGLRDRDSILDGLARARANGKPVIFMKVGRSAMGAAAAVSHTAALAGSDAVYDAVFRQYGVHRARTTEEMLDIAYACTAGVFPKGRRIGLVTISGGVGVQMADDATDLGLDVAPMPERAQARLKEILPYAATRNPVDITAQAFNDLSLVSRNFELMLEDGDYDVIVAFFTMVAASPYIVDGLIETLVDLRRRFPDRPIILSIVGAPEVVARYEAAGYLVFEDASRAVAAAAALVGFGESFARSDPAPPPAAPARAIDIPRRAMSEHEAKTVLAAAGVPVIEERLVHGPDQAAAAAEALGLPVAMKINARGLAHKSDIGGVLLDVGTAEDVRRGYETLTTRVDVADVDGVLVSPMVTGTVETILGTQRDPLFGPVVMFGLGGVFTEVLRDVAFRLAPIGTDEAQRMIREIKGAEVLTGMRGRSAADIDALAQAIARLSVLAAAHTDEIESIDVNPFLVRPAGQGAVAVDAFVVPRPATD